MTIQNLAPMLAAASAGGYAVAQFNTDTLEIGQAVLRAAATLRAPVILAIGQGVDRAGRLAPLAAGLRTMAEAAEVPVCLHLDHSESLSQIQRAIQAGFSGIMIDASAHPLAANIEQTRRVLALCAGRNIGVEAELGRVAGVEDDLVVSEDEAGKVGFATVSAFLEKVRPDALAVAVGTAHGLYTRPPEIDFALIRQVRDLGAPPLVLHGGSGLSEEILREAIACGIAKLNFATELRKVCLDALVAAATSQSGFMPALASAADAVTDFAARKLEITGSAGKR
ncbi:class II fructose-bisphosphate aldolase [Tropicimonas sp. IMCC34043]|uniref:class II fructose-bisphosphate aldolase n=1 Tax=Tropicimonas sp. IMCC34043 TaxID=2248760 RepID=UPI000E2572CE|nr:class II fructose-bisphosphate aldolase [Tropicimonas sp. IMCC34043]